MNTGSLLDILEQELTCSGCDLRAEAQLALALGQHLCEEDFLVACNGFFHRPYSRDVLAKERKTDALKMESMWLYLSRTGIYDQLPEGLFHDHTADEDQTDAAAMADLYKANKRKEQASRLFFMPLENEFFHHRLVLEKEESRMLQGFQSGALNDYLLDFWNIPPSLPERYAIPLITLIPYAHQIAGNLSLTETCLHEILQEQISIKRKYLPAQHASSEQAPRLGEQELGTDAMCGELVQPDYPVLEICIGPLQDETLKDYLDGGKKTAFMDIFYAFFIPAYADVVTIVEAEKNSRLHAEAALVLGYTSAL